MASPIPEQPATSEPQNPIVNAFGLLGLVRVIYGVQWKVQDRVLRILDVLNDTKLSHPCNKLEPNSSSKRRISSAEHWRLNPRNHSVHAVATLMRRPMEELHRHQYTDQDGKTLQMGSFCRVADCAGSRLLADGEALSVTTMKMEETTILDA
nr:hypothetical protein Iba_chr08dCG12790 [Ipomoea batatas]